MIGQIKENYRFRFWVSISLLIILGLILLVVSEFIDNKFAENVISDIAAALFISGVIGLINEFLLKDKLVELILSKINLKAHIDKTGVRSIHSTLNDIDFAYYIKNSTKSIDIHHIYARTWTTNLHDELLERIRRSNCKIRVVLLAPDSKFLPGLADLYDITTEELTGRILEVEKIWIDLYKEKQKMKKKKTQSCLELYYHSGFPSYSYYKFDDTIITVQSKPTTGRSKTLPILICNDTDKTDDLFDLYGSHFKEVIECAEKVDLDQKLIELSA
jgi:hypothetical protein